MKKIIITKKDGLVDISIECENEMDIIEIHHMLRGAMREIKMKHMKSKKDKGE